MLNNTEKGFRLYFVQFGVVVLVDMLANGYIVKIKHSELVRLV